MRFRLLFQFWFRFRFQSRYGKIAVIQQLRYISRHENAVCLTLKPFQCGRFVAIRPRFQSMAGFDPRSLIITYKRSYQLCLLTPSLMYINRDTVLTVDTLTKLEKNIGTSLIILQLTLVNQNRSGYACTKSNQLFVYLAIKPSKTRQDLYPKVLNQRETNETSYCL